MSQTDQILPPPPTRVTAQSIIDSALTQNRTALQVFTVLGVLQVLIVVGFLVAYGLGQLSSRFLLIVFVAAAFLVWSIRLALSTKAETAKLELLKDVLQTIETTDEAQKVLQVIKELHVRVH